MLKRQLCYPPPEKISVESEVATEPAPVEEPEASEEPAEEAAAPEAPAEPEAETTAAPEVTEEPAVEATAAPEATEEPAVEPTEAPLTACPTCGVEAAKDPLFETNHAACAACGLRNCDPAAARVSHDKCSGCGMQKCDAEYNADAHMKCAGCRELLCAGETEHVSCPGCHRYTCKAGDNYADYTHILNDYGRYTCLDYPEEPMPEPTPVPTPKPTPTPKPSPIPMPEDLANQLASPGAAPVELPQDVDADTPIEIGGGNTLDGNGNTLDVSNVDAGSDCAVNTPDGGTVKDLTITGDGSGRALGTGSSGDDTLTGDLHIHNVTIDYVTYAINGSGNGSASVCVEDSTIYGWCSYSNIEEFSFTNCTLGKGHSYAGYIPVYGKTTFTNCTFKNFDMCARPDAAGCTITFTNCTNDNQKVTVDNFVELFLAPGDEAEFNLLGKCKIVIDGKTLTWVDVPVTTV